MRAPKLLVIEGDRDLSDQVRRATAALTPAPEVVWCDALDGVDEVVAGQGPFALIVAGPVVSTGAGLQELRRLSMRLPQTGLILALDHWRSGSLRDTIRTGALDLLKLPVTDEALLDAVEQALEARWVTAVAAADRRTPNDRQGTVIAVVSATGGCGKTFFATNLAYHLRARRQRRTCLVDLDLQFGELSTALRLKPKYTIADLLSKDADQDDLGRRLEDHVEQHDTGISVLAAPEEPADADALDPSDVAGIIEAAKSRFDCVVLDTPAALSETVLVALEHADQVFALATLDLPSVRNLGVLLATFKKLKVPADRVKLVLNKVEPDVGIDLNRVTKYFPQGFSMLIPYGREVNRALNMGMPMLAYAPRSEVGKVLDGGLSSTVALGDLDGERVPDDADGNPKGRRHGRLPWRRQTPV